MPMNKMIFLGEKEAFIARVLIKKIKDTGAECEFVSWTVKEISANISDASLLTIYMDDGVVPEDEVLHYLSDTIE